MTLELPNYNKYRIQNKWGYDIVDLAHSVGNTIQNRILKRSPHSQVTLIIHDWGALIGFITNKFYPHLFNRIAAIDIGDNGRQSEWTSKQKLMVIGYQWYNIIAHFTPSIIGDFMTRKAAQVFNSPLTRKNQFGDIHAGMNYLYWTVWKRILMNNKQDLMIRQYPKQPVFFAYGSKNPLKFHTNTFAKYLNERDDCYYEGYNAGHWVMFDEPDRLINNLKLWLNKTNDKVYKLQSKL